MVTLTGEDAGETIDGLHVYTLHEIGYGSGEGFKGWNCRHDWHAYYKGISKPNYTPEQIKKLNEKNISYNGKKYTKYEISQMQRQGERNVRALKRRTLAAQAAVENATDEETKAVLQADYAANAAIRKAAENVLQPDRAAERHIPGTGGRVWTECGSEGCPCSEKSVDRMEKQCYNRENRKCGRESNLCCK